MSTAAARLQLSGTTRPRSDAPTGAERVRRAVTSWEGVTVRDGHARLGRDDLGRLPRRVIGFNVQRTIERFRTRYNRAADLVDRRAGVRA
jgi:hypothetical protein